ncbi:VOC family protein [Alisedimentitalea sp. MJ-SS2]|uniref:VOC family protein n=1 Tax=Aliisedimentitalea sp. MJ-SS2 TaxID=3049795 RepID=UPI0029090AE2|nr:VOC family protein [Alisedimentitalea sp. MJ-SS2]MDU8926642.1 VOC family protein [Alisedimentitalea sp. MJ-SS2]
MMKLDHIAVAAETLEEGRAYVEDALGVALEPGGKHTKLGTHNMLMGLEDGVYFELISIDPDAPDPGLRRWFNLDDFAGAPRLTNWICQTEDLEDALAVAPEQMGQPIELTRGDLRWMMAAGIEGRLPFEQGFPAMISWGDSPHPSTRLKPSGLRLERLVITNPEAEALRKALAPLIADTRIMIVQGDVGMRAEFSSPSGQKVLE